MLILVRHGESTANAAGLLVGRQDAPLTERGLDQAHTLGPVLANITRVISSPLARARATADALGTGLPVEIDERWVEIDYGEFDGEELGSVPAWQVVASRVPWLGQAPAGPSRTGATASGTRARSCRRNATPWPPRDRHECTAGRW